MPSLEINQRLWMTYDWRNGGEEWSDNWGGTSNLWHAILLPRISGFLGDVRALEIAPGYGRLTAYLKDHCSSLVLVDLAPNCIEFCRRRFGTQPNIDFYVNDGRSLPFIRDETIDFVFSFDSLVHSDLDTISAYLVEVERILKMGGRAILHHSNLASLPNLPPAGTATHLRARDVSADRIANVTAGLKTLECRTQELISWDESLVLIDCISSFVRCQSPNRTRLDRFVNPDFYCRAKELKEISCRYIGAQAKSKYNPVHCNKILPD